MPTAARLVAVVPLLAGLAWASLAAVDVIRADSLLRDAGTEMSTWATAPAVETWNSVHEKLQSAIALRPRDPAGLELMGLLGTMRRDSPKFMDEGLAHLVKALELRPVSPHAWGSLLEARYARGESGPALELVLARAAQLGPSEPGVQRQVADYGLAVWNEVGPATRSEIERMIAAGMRRNPLEMLRISDRRGRLEAACRHVVGSATRDPRVGRHCERWEITP